LLSYRGLIVRPAGIAMNDAAGRDYRAEGAAT